MQRPLLTIAALALIVGGRALAQENMALNGGAEELADPAQAGLAHWNLYGGAASAEIGQAEDGYRGKCAFIRLKAFAPSGEKGREGEDYINVGLVQGDSNGYTGPDAYVHVPPPEARFFKRGLPTRYTVSWWMCGDAGPVNVGIKTWSTEEATADARGGAGLLGKTMPNEEWTHYEATAVVGGEARRFCVQFQIYGFKAEGGAAARGAAPRGEPPGVKLGTLYVDEVSIIPGAPMQPDEALKRVVIPDRPRIFIGETPIEELAEAYAAGDDNAKTRVDGIIAGAQNYAHLTDEALRDLFPEFEPRGNYSVCCPIHPFLVRYYNDFKWSADDPWHLVCPYCQKEGREHFKYPNPRYPDEGAGCMPTDEVWRADHDAEWSRSHRGIPWDRWDGVCHGYTDTRAFYFTGKCYCNVIQRITTGVLRRLAEAYQVCDKLLPADDPRRELAATFAHQGQAIMLLLGRAHLGDEYLAAANGMAPDEYCGMICDFMRAEDGAWRYRPYPGFRPMVYPRDAVLGDPAWADHFEAKDRTAALTYYFGSWNLRASFVDAWIQAACLLRDSYAPEQERLGLHRLAQRVIVSQEGDRERLAESSCEEPYLKRGLIEYEVHPYNLESGGDNLLTSSLRPRLKLGLMLGDDEIIEKIAQDITYFWSNMASGDGMGKEGSPTYAGGTWAVSGIAEKLHGMKGEFDRSAPYYDAELGGLNLLGMLRYRRCLGLMDCLMPDGLYISFEDSCHGGSFGLSNAARVEKYCGGVPEPYRGCLDLRRAGEDIEVSLKEAFTLPSHLLHDNRKAILRCGEGRRQMLAALDYSMVVGHYHEAPLSLMVYAKGHELASDLGYMGSAHHLTTKWIRTFASHNSLIIRGEDGSPYPTRPLRGDLGLFDAGSTVQMVEVAERDPADLKDGLGDESGVYQRTIALVRCGEEDGYVVDVCRARGGALHDYQFHSHGQELSTEGVALKSVGDQDQTLYDLSGFTFKTPGKYGSRNVDRLSVGTSAGPFTATWSEVDRYQKGHKGPVERDHEVALRLWMLDEAGSRIIAGRAPGQRFLRNEDFGREITQLRVRRPNTETVDEFVAVIEPYRSEPFIRSVERLEAPEGVVAVKVVSVAGTDYVVSSLDEDPVELRDGDTVVQTAGRFCAASLDKAGEPSWLYVVRGTSARVRDFEVVSDGPSCWTGTVEGMRAGDFALLIRADPPLPAGDRLAGQVLIVQHSRGRSSFTISHVEPPRGGTQRVVFAHMPKLLENVVLVRDAEPTRLVVEPPPVLVGSPVDYYVYHLANAGLQPLGKLERRGSVGVLDERGRRLHYFSTLQVPDTEGVADGDEVAISRIVPGNDTFEIPMRAFVGRQQE